jgi:C4-dicarboxylate-binding protein DctP
MSEPVIRLSGYQSARSVHTRALNAMAGELRQRLGAGVEIRVTDNITAVGRRADELLTLTEGDELDICYFASSYLAARVPALDLFDEPFRFADRQDAYALLDSAMGRQIADDMAHATGFRVLAFWDNGFRHISNGRRPIRSPTDCVGLRIRTLNNARHQAFFRRLGFQPVFLDVKDLVQAAADGSIDAQENPLTNIVNFELHRYHRFVSLTAHLFGVALLLVNRRRFDDWTQDVRSAIRAAAEAATVAQRREAATEDESCFDRLSAEGVEIIAPAELDRAAFARAVT